MGQTWGGAQNYQGWYGYVNQADLNGGQGCVSVNTASADPDCFACENGSVVTLPLSQIDQPWPASATMCGFEQNATGGWIGYYVDQAALTNASGSCQGPPPPPPSTGTGAPEYLGNPCDEYSMLGRLEQEDICERCTVDPSDPMCECCPEGRRDDEERPRGPLQEKVLLKLVRETIRKSIREMMNEDWNAEEQRCDGPLIPATDQRCKNCTGWLSSNAPPYNGIDAGDTGPECECCEEETTIGTGEGPCYEDPRPGTEVPRCWYCKSNDCQQVGSFPYFTNADAVAAGVNLYENKIDCNDSEDACSPEPEECGCCCDYVTAQQAEQLGGTLGKPIGGPEPVPTDGCKPGSPTVPAVWSVTKHECICTDPSKPYLIPGSTQPCKGQETPPTRGISHTENSIYESKKLREEIQKELFGK
jgi:hypothetical protein